MDTFSKHNCLLALQKPSALNINLLIIKLKNFGVYKPNFTMIDLLTGQVFMISCTKAREKEPFVPQSIVNEILWNQKQKGRYTAFSNKLEKSMHIGLEKVNCAHSRILPP